MRRERLLGILRAILFLGCIALFTSSYANAQMTPPAEPQGWNAEDTAETLGELTPAERAELLSRLSDEQARDLLLAYLGTRGAGADGLAPESMLTELSAQSQTIRKNLDALLAEFKNLPSVPSFAVEKLLAGRTPIHLLWIILALAGLHLLGTAAEWLFRRKTSEQFEQLRAAEPEDLGGKLTTLLTLTAFRFIGLAIFAVATLAGFFVLYQGHQPSRLLFMTYLFAVLIVRFADFSSRFLVSPAAPDLRLIPLDDEAAKRLHNRVVLLFAIGAFGFLGCSFFNLLGLDPELHSLMVTLVGLVLSVAAIISVWQLRQPIGALMLRPNEAGRPPGPLFKLFARTWHLPIILYITGVFVVAVVKSLANQPVGAATALASLFLILAVPIVDAAVGALIDALGRRTSENRKVASQEEEPLEVEGEGEGEAESEAEAVAMAEEHENLDFIRILRRASRIVLALVVVLLFASLWGVDLLSLSQRGVGAVVMRVALDIGFTLLVAYVAWEVVRIGIDRQLAKAPGGGEPAERGSEGSGAGSRLLTLLPLFRRFFQIAIAVLAAMIILSALGVDIGPLLAGAGVIGLAIGFGAQTLVRDIVSGVFFLLDDAFRLGEYVDVGDAKGTVEAINVRSLVLRHHRGPLHTIPFGEIKYLTNFSRDWVIMKLEFRVPYDTDIQKVKKIFKQIGAELLDHPLYGDNFLEPVKSQGVMRMEDSAMILRAKFMAKPGTQWPLRREVFTRVQQAFKEAGIEFARKRVEVELPPDLKLDEEQARKLAEAAGAAAAAAEEDENAQQPQGTPKAATS